MRKIDSKKFLLYFILISFLWLIFYFFTRETSSFSIGKFAWIIILNFIISGFLAWLLIEREELENKNFILQQHKKSQEKIKENETFYRNIFELSGVGIVEISLDGKFLMANNKFCDIIGYSEHELKKKSFKDIIYIEDLFEYINEVKEVLCGKVNGYNLEKRFMCKDGSIIWCNITASIVKEIEANAGYFVCIINDITENKKNEIELKKQSKAMKYSPLSIVITDKEGKIEYVNPAFESVSGFKKEEVIGNNPKITGSGEQSKAFYKKMWDTICDGKTWKGIFKNKKKNGEIYWEEASISPIINVNNKITHFVAIKEDITKRKKIEEQLIKSKKEAERANKVKSAFIANMSHEIRTPLNSILGFSSLLLDDSNLSWEQKNKLEIINNTGEHLLKIINEILEISKLDAGRITVDTNQFNLHRLMSDLKNMFSLKADDKNIDLNFVYSEMIPQRIISDELKLKQILINLIGNAIKFTDKGSVTVFTEIVSSSDNHWLKISIKDTGIGIKKENLNKIFDYFTQIYNEKYSKGGTGLGLSIVKEFVELLNGEISVSSQCNEGSEFKVVLPIKLVKEDVANKSFEELKADSKCIGRTNNTLIDKAFVLNIDEEVKDNLRDAVLDGDIEKINEILTGKNIENLYELNCLKKLCNEFKFEKILELLQ